VQQLQGLLKEAQTKSETLQEQTCAERLKSKQLEEAQQHLESEWAAKLETANVETVRLDSLLQSCQAKWAQVNSTHLFVRQCNTRQVLIKLGMCGHAAYVAVP
jgi:hypothetical protein